MLVDRARQVGLRRPAPAGPPAAPASAARATARQAQRGIDGGAGPVDGGGAPLAAPASVKARHRRARSCCALPSSSPAAPRPRRAARADVLAAPPAGDGRQVVRGGHGDGIGAASARASGSEPACARTTARPCRRCRRGAGGRGSRAAPCRDPRRSRPRRGDAIRAPAGAADRPADRRGRRPRDAGAPRGTSHSRSRPMM